VNGGNGEVKVIIRNIASIELYLNKKLQKSMEHNAKGVLDL